MTGFPASLGIIAPGNGQWDPQHLINDAYVDLGVKRITLVKKQSAK